MESVGWTIGRCRVIQGASVAAIVLHDLKSATGRKPPAANQPLLWRPATKGRRNETCLNFFITSVGLPGTRRLSHVSQKLKGFFSPAKTAFPWRRRAEGARLTRVGVIIGRAIPERSRDYVSLRELGYFV